MKKTLLPALLTLLLGQAEAQVIMSNTPPLFGTTFTLSTIAASGITDASSGANQSWTYGSATVTPVMAYKVVDPTTLPAAIKDSVPTADFAYQMQGGAPVDQAAYDFFSNETTHYLKVGVKSSGSQPVNKKSDTAIWFNQTYGSNQVYAGFNNVYDGYGTLTVKTKVYPNVVKMKLYQTGSSDTAVQFFQFSPFFHRIMSYAKMSGTIQNVVYWELTGTTGLAESLNPQLAVYPNPVTNQVTVSVGREAAQIAVEVIDLAGRRWIDQGFTKTSEVTVCLSSLPAGHYLVHVQADHISMVKRIVKE